MSFFVKLPGGTEQEILDFNISIGGSETHIEILTDKNGNVIARKPTITTQPAGTTIDDTQTATLSVTADGLGSTMSYQWYIDDTAISGATAASYTFTPSTTGTYSFYCRVSGFGGYTQTDEASVIVEASYSLSITVGTDGTAYYGYQSAYDPTFGLASGEIKVGGQSYPASDINMFKSSNNTYTTLEIAVPTSHIYTGGDEVVIMFNPALASGITEMACRVGDNSEYGRLVFTAKDGDDQFTSADNGASYGVRFTDSA